MKYVDQMGIKHIDKTNLKAPITRGFDINWKLLNMMRTKM